MNFKDRILTSWPVKGAYAFKYHLDLGIQQISWITGKFVEIMAFDWLVNKAGWTLTADQYVIFGIVVVTCLEVLGLCYHKFRLYHTERYVQASKDPVYTEILNASRKINSADFTSLIKCLEIVSEKIKNENKIVYKTSINT